MTSSVQVFCGNCRLVFGWLLTVCLGLAVPTAALAQAATGKLGAPPRLADVQSWGYQLQGVDPAVVANSSYDLVVVDYSRNGTDTRRFTPAEVQQMQTRPDGSRRLLIAYLSIGEAEDFRYYWSRNWVEAAPLRDGANDGASVELPRGVETVRIPKLNAPSWLGRENEQWRGNYQVRYWHSSWQELIVHGQDSYLSRIISAGFDGVLLDRVDAFHAIEREMESGKAWMVNFISELAAAARQRKDGFIVLAQNPDELLRDERFLSVIDGVAKEDLLFGGDVDSERNSQGSVQKSLRNLSAARGLGLPVLAVEYLSEPQHIDRADSELRSRGIIPYFGPRALDRLVVRAIPQVERPVPVE